MGQIRGSSCFQGLMRKQLLATAGFSYWGLQAREAEVDLSFSLGRITSRYFLSFLTLTGFPPLLLPSPALLQMIPSDLRDIFSPVCPASSPSFHQSVNASKTSPRKHPGGLSPPQPSATNKRTFLDNSLKSPKSYSYSKQ